MITPDPRSRQPLGSFSLPLSQLGQNLMPNIWPICWLLTFSNYNFLIQFSFVQNWNLYAFKILLTASEIVSNNIKYSFLTYFQKPNLFHSMEREVYGFLIGNLYCRSYFFREELLFQSMHIKARVVNSAKVVECWLTQREVLDSTLNSGREKMVMKLRTYINGPILWSSIYETLGLASTIVSVWWVARTMTKNFHEGESYFGYWKWLWIQSSLSLPSNSPRLYTIWEK